jgi:3-hydroxyisobutyrate dehydrogenase-like beta-hydroxyacid dehydrogenase
MGASVLFCGDKESDNWHMLQKAGWFITENDTMHDNVKSFLFTLKDLDITQKKAAAVQISTQLQENVRKTYEFIQAKAR